ncbi:MAG: primosomal protein N' [Saprospiraceae bacterium]|nr:primosomal protein N' [Saprospiraceae bacterium]
MKTESTPALFVAVLLPLAIEKAYTYSVPEELCNRISFGMRVEVQFGRSRHYSGLVVGFPASPSDPEKIKPILEILDTGPVIHEQQFTFWTWIAEYYCCSLGEVMIAALPSHLKLSSETRIIPGPQLEDAFPRLNDDAYLIAEALSIRQEITVEDAKKILDRKTVYPLLMSLVQEGVIAFREDLQERFKPRMVAAVKLHTRLHENRQGTLPQVMEELNRSKRQLEALMAFLQMEKERPWIRKSEWMARAEIQDGILRSLVKKEILEVYQQEVSRLGTGPGEDAADWVLSPHQEKALQSMLDQFQKKETVLLQGVTGSGKTLLYAKAIEKVIREGKQVLFLLPEIALTTQLVSRVEQLTGRTVLTYHSRLNQQERVEIWRAVLTKPDMIVLGPRSGLFLPFFNLGLIIVDEEHDGSYKQHDPAPRYHGRDLAIMLGHHFKAKTILGSATPSLESYYHAKKGKYGYVLLTERYGNAVLPELRLINLKQETIKGNQAPFSQTLIQSIKDTIARGEQILLFQNRRGYAPNLQCGTCQWVQPCIHCDVSLTYHKPSHKMHCHYCGYQTAIPIHCPQCGNRQLTLKGFGTQRIEDDLKIFFPEARIGRLDLDTARSRQSLTRILDDFSEKKLDILVGTQMITKGLDFEHLGLVGILQADQLISYPDFRASERGFQMMVQVAGRAGRREGHSLVLIQTYEPANAVLQDVLHLNMEGFYIRELQERKAFHYPPYGRIVRITIKHRREEKCEWAAHYMVKQLTPFLGDAVQGPATPGVPRINNYYLRTVQVKLSSDASKLRYAKESILQIAAAMRTARGMSGLIVSPDVDPV